MLLAKSFECLNRSLIERDVPRRAILAARDRERLQRDGNIFPQQTILLAEADSAQ